MVFRRSTPKTPKPPKPPKANPGAGFDLFGRYTQPSYIGPPMTVPEQSRQGRNAGMYEDIPVPPSDGFSLEDIIGLINPGGGGPSGGRAASRPTNPDPMGWNAIAREQALKQAYAGMGGALDQQGKAQMDALSGRESRVTQSGADARKRIEDSIAGLNTMATQTGEQVGQAYGRAGADIDQLLGQYAGQQQALGQGAARTLGAFGVGPEELGVLGPSIQQTMGAYRGGLSALGGISQADIAQRPLAYQALSADRLAGLTANEQRELAQIADERARAEADIARQKAELAYRQLPELFGIQDAEIARRERFA